MTEPDLPGAMHGCDKELKRIYALSKFHGTALGGGLMQEVLSTAASHNASRLLLGVYAGNTRALAFYKKYGFQQIGTRQFKVGDQEYNDKVLAKSLNE